MSGKMSVVCRSQCGSRGEEDDYMRKRSTMRRMSGWSRLINEYVKK